MPARTVRGPASWAVPAALALALVLLHPAPAAAQECGTRPGCVAAVEPSVTLTPASGSTFTGTAPEHRLVVTISWCDDGALDLASRRVRVDSLELPDTEFVPMPSARAGCMGHASATDTITLPPGTHTVASSIQDLAGLLGEGAAEYTYTVASAATPLVSAHASTTASAGARGSPGTPFELKRSLPASRGEHVLVLGPVLDHLGRAAGDAGERLAVAVHRQAGILRQQTVEAFEQSASAGEHKPRIDDVAGKLRRRGLEGLRHICSTLLAAAADAVVLCLDECDIHLMPVLRAMWMRRGQQADVPTPGKNRKRSIFGALELEGGAFHYTITGSKKAVDFIAFLEKLVSAYPGRPMYLVLDNASIHHAKLVQTWLKEHPQVHLLFLPAYSGHKYNRSRRCGGI